MPPEPAELTAPDQTLPAGLVGEPYEVHLQVGGGDPPYTWRLADPGASFPGGLALDPDGAIHGVPTQAGTFSIGLDASDAMLRTERVYVTLHVVLEPEIVRCGETLSGTFTSGGGLYGADLDQLDGLAWLAVELPHDDTTRIELAFTNEASTTLYVERPSEPLGSWALEDHYRGFYLNPTYPDAVVTVDAGTDPSLSGYETEALLPLLLVAHTDGEWSMEVVCTDGPVFTETRVYPARLGEPFAWDFDVYGDNSDVRIRTDDPVPDWMSWDEQTGIVSGTAMERGAWEVTLVAETSDGKRREARTVLGVYDVLPVECGETVPFEVEEDYFGGEFYAYFDPRGYRVFRLPLDAVDTSRIAVTVSGSDQHYLGIAMPDPDGLEFYGGADHVYSTSPQATLAVDPRTYPAVGHYLEARELYLSAGTLNTVEPMWLTVTCDDTPRPDLAGLPVLEPFVPVDLPLQVVGGVPPFTWEADGLPSGITLDRFGVLAGSTGTIGTSEVEITVTDDAGVSWSDTYTLHVGAEAACEGYTRLACGDTVQGEFTEVYYTDGNGPDSTEVLCAVHPGGNVGFEVTSGQGEVRIDVADPGRTAEEMFRDQGTYVAYVERDSSDGAALDPFSWPDGDDYAGMRVLVGIRAYDPGDWTAHLVCQ